MSQQSSNDIFTALLGKSATTVGHLDNYLQIVEPEEAQKLQQLSEAALFDELQRTAACVQFGRLEFVREFRRKLAPFVAQYKQQYTR